MKYKVGDEVTILSFNYWRTIVEVDLNWVCIDVPNCSYCIVSEMIPYLGSVARIVKVDNRNNRYHLDIDDNRFSWSDGMLWDGVDNIALI